MSYSQWVEPNLDAVDGTGMCLRFVQRVFQNLNPYYYDSATSAWQNTIHRSSDRSLPRDAAVPVYFSHWGTYGDPARFDNWGHIVAWVPWAFGGNGGFLSSPTGWMGRQWFSSIEAVEGAFGAKYSGWALDVGGLVVAWPKTPAPVPTPIPIPVPVIEEEILKRSYTPTFKPNTVCKPGEWTTIVVNADQWVSIMNAGDKRRIGTVHTALRCTGEFEARYLYSTVDPSQKNKVVSESGSVVAKYDEQGIHIWPFAIKAKSATSEERIRVQVRPVGTKPIKVTSVRAIVDYQEG